MRRRISQCRRSYGRYIPRIQPGDADVSDVTLDNARSSGERMQHRKRLKRLTRPQMGKAQTRGFDVGLNEPMPAGINTGGVLPCIGTEMNNVRYAGRLCGIDHRL